MNWRVPVRGLRHSRRISPDKSRVVAKRGNFDGRASGSPAPSPQYLSGKVDPHSRQLEPDRGWLRRVEDFTPVTRADWAHDGSVVYFKPSLLPAESSSIDSRIRLSRVLARLAV